MLTRRVSCAAGVAEKNRGGYGASSSLQPHVPGAVLRMPKHRSRSKLFSRNTYNWSDFVVGWGFSSPMENERWNAYT